MDQDVVAAADANARHWQFASPGRIGRGEDRYRTMFCRMLLDTFNPYKPSVIEWPVMAPEVRERVVNLPIWDIAVQTEGRARARIYSYARTLRDPLLRQAMEHMAWEENRHKEVLSHMVNFYDIQLDPEPEYVEPRDPEWGWMVTGYSECIDSFFAFGLFELAKRSGFFPQPLIDTFEPVIQEEGRHIIFFINWIAWHKRTMPWWRRPYFLAKTVAVWAFLVSERIGLARDVSMGEKENANFAATGAADVTGQDIGITELMAICLEQNDRRMAGYDPRLLRPTTMPNLTRIALAVLRLRLPGRRRLAASAR